jgi:hypothetical protein
MAIKILRALRQQKNITTEQFQKLWRQQVGPLMASLQTSLSVIKYVQNHRAPGEVDTSLRSARQNLVQEGPPFDIVEELYFDGIMAEFVENYHSERGVKAWQSIREATGQYLDLPQCHISIVEERPFVLAGSPPNLIASEWNHVVKAVAMVQAENDATTNIEYWGRSHAALTQRWASSLGIIQYVQNHRYDPPILAEVAQDFGFMKISYDICAMVWVDAGQTGEASQRAQVEIRKDEDSGFIKPHTMMCFAGKEHIFVDQYRA